MRFLNRILPVTIVVLALASTASAKTRVTVAPPGDSGISQYLEVVPTGAGGSPPRAGGRAGQGSVLSANQSRELNSLGTNGRTLESVVDATAPQTFGIGHPSRGISASGARSGAVRRAGAGGTSGLHPAPSASPASLILGAAAGHGGGGLGFLLPGFMVASALAVTLLAVRRRRASP